MNLGTLLQIFADIIKLLKGMGLIDQFGNFRAPTPQEDSVLASRVTAILELYGVDVPDRIEKVLAILPLILQLAGVK